MRVQKFKTPSLSMPIIGLLPCELDPLREVCLEGFEVGEILVTGHACLDVVDDVVRCGGHCGEVRSVLPPSMRRSEMLHKDLQYCTVKNTLSLLIIGFIIIIYYNRCVRNFVPFLFGTLFRSARNFVPFLFGTLFRSRPPFGRQFVLHSELLPLLGEIPSLDQPIHHLPDTSLGQVDSLCYIIHLDLELLTMNAVSLDKGV